MCGGGFTETVSNIDSKGKNVEMTHGENNSALIPTQN